MASETPLVAKVVGGGLCVAVAVTLICIAIIRPSGMWAAPKIQNTVKVLGDTGMSALLIVLGLLSLGGGLLIILKR